MVLDAKLCRDINKHSTCQRLGISTFIPSRIHASMINFVFFFSTYVKPLNGVSAEARYNRLCVVGSVTKLLNSTGFGEYSWAKRGDGDDVGTEFGDAAIAS
jgi:hypothetical protein